MDGPHLIHEFERVSFRDGSWSVGLTVTNPNGLAVDDLTAGFRVRRGDHPDREASGSGVFVPLPFVARLDLPPGGVARFHLHRSFLPELAALCAADPDAVTVFTASGGRLFTEIPGRHLAEFLARCSAAEGGK